jgi:signal transduction histidine kinase
MLRRLRLVCSCGLRQTVDTIRNINPSAWHGVGVAINRRFSQMMSGDIAREAGKGSTFTVTLPTEVREMTK